LIWTIHFLFIIKSNQIKSHLKILIIINHNMSNTENPSSLTAAAASFRAALSNDYELENDFLDAMENLFMVSARPLLTESSAIQTGGTPAPKRRTKKVQTTASGASDDSVKDPRRKSAYNMYVKEQMNTDDVKGIDHKKKMAHIATTWRALDEAGKKVYIDMAAAVNAQFGASVAPSTLESLAE
jgi:hypothetical protein